MDINKRWMIYRWIYRAFYLFGLIMLLTGMLLSMINSPAQAGGVRTIAETATVQPPFEKQPAPRQPQQQKGPVSVNRPEVSSQGFGLPPVQGTQAQPGLPMGAGSVRFLTQDTAICMLGPGILEGTVEVSLPEGESAILQTAYRIAQPPDRRTDNVYSEETVQDGDRVTVSGEWPGVRPGDQVVEVHFGAILLDAGTHNPISAGAGLDYYWYPYVCGPPTSPPPTIEVDNTATPTTTATPTLTSPPPTVGVDNTATPTATATLTLTSPPPTVGVEDTGTPTPTLTVVAGDTSTPTSTATATLIVNTTTPTPTATWTLTSPPPTVGVDNTATPTVTVVSNTSTPSNTPTVTVVTGNTSTPTPTFTVTVSANTATPTLTRTATLTQVPPTVEAGETSTSTPPPTLTASATQPDPSSTPTLTRTATQVPPTVGAGQTSTNTPPPTQTASVTPVIIVITATSGVPVTGATATMQLPTPIVIVVTATPEIPVTGAQQETAVSGGEGTPTLQSGPLQAPSPGGQSLVPVTGADLANQPLATTSLPFWQRATTYLGLLLLGIGLIMQGLAKKP